MTTSGDYHVPPATGVPEPCGATVRACPLVHGGNPNEAVKNFEIALAKGDPAATAVPTPIKKTKKTPVKPTAAAATANNTSTAKWENMGSRHTDTFTADDIISNGPGRNMPTDWYPNRNAGTINPTTGDGDEYGHWDDSGSTFVVLAQKNGKRARAVATYGGVDPNELGRKVEQEKQGATTTYTYDLYVVGIVKDGDRTGFVPDKKISYFVMK